MADKLRVVLDTNVVLAAYLSKNPRSPTRELLDRWRAGEFVQLYSDGTLAEVVEKLTAKETDATIVVRYVADLERLGEHVVVTPEDVMPVIPADPDDDLIIACAVVGKATHIVTYDPHYDILGGEYRGVKIVDGLHFLHLIRGDHEQH